MKKQIALAISILICSIRPTMAQDELKSNYGINYLIDEQNQHVRKIKQYKIKHKTTITRYRFRSFLTTSEFDSTGYVSMYCPDKKTRIEIRYQKDEKKKEYSIFEKNKLIEKDTFLYNGGQVTDAFKLDKHNKIFETKHYDYNDTLLKSFTFSKRRFGKIKERKKYEYEYYEDKSYKKIVYYKKGKLKKYTTFDCNPIGENHKIKNDSAYLCVKYDVDSLGNKIKISVRNENKYSYKTVEYYNKEDKVVTQKVFDLKKNALKYVYTFYKGNPLLTTRGIFYKRGKENYRVENKYDDKDNWIGGAYYHRGKLISENIVTYDSKGLIESQIQRKPKGKIIGETHWEYSFY